MEIIIITDKARENGGMHRVQNWRIMRDKERWIFLYRKVSKLTNTKRKK